MSCNRCKDTHKFGNKYLPSVYKTQVDFRPHFSGKKVRLIVREIWYMLCLNVHVAFWVYKIHSAGYLCVWKLFVMSCFQLYSNNFILVFITGISSLCFQVLHSVCMYV